LGRPYTYHLRPGYGSDKLLLEFFLDSSDTDFLNDLFTTLKDIGPKIETVENWWMNDEVLLHVSSDKGEFLFSRDVWDFAFILADNNQSCIKLIDEMLNNSSWFKKEEVDFGKYRNVKT
jgi:hypothetical protein